MYGLVSQLFHSDHEQDITSLTSIRSYLSCWTPLRIIRISWCEKHDEKLKNGKEICHETPCQKEGE